FRPTSFATGGSGGNTKRSAKNKTRQPTRRGLDRVAPYQKLIFNPNCKTRIAARRLRISPTRGASGVTELGEMNPRLFGWPKNGVLKALKASPRNCTFNCSVSVKFLNMEKSRFLWPGEVMMFLPALP